MTHQYMYSKNYFKLFYCLLVMGLGCYALPIFAQNDTNTSEESQNGINKQTFRVNIKKATDEIKIDGLLLEESWKNAEPATQFHNKWPNDEGLAPLQTTVSLTYDDNNLYLSAICEEDTGDLVIQTLKRDDVIWRSDGFGLTLDPVNTQTNGFTFFTNALGVQTEGLVSALSSGDEGMSRDWDNKWFVETTRGKDGTWLVEMAIPFKTLRYDPNLTEWGINFLRCDLGSNAYSTWAEMPLQIDATDLSFAGTLSWDAKPPVTKSNFSIIPYITGDVTQDYEDSDGTPTPSYDVGLDAKVAVTSSLNLDLTVNPDFSQIEVDVQQTNLTRFSLFFPERRTFFLENSDLFAQFGIRPARPFFSRRVGLDEDGNAIPILFGARLSGNLTENMRIGAMSMQTKATETELAQNYSVATVQQRVWKRSTVKGIFINRQAYGEGEFLDDDFGRNAGGQFNYASPDGKYSAWVGYNASFKPEKYDDNTFRNFGGQYNGRAFRTSQSFATIGENYIADAGFIQRLDNYDAARDTTIRIGFHQWYNNTGYSFFPKKENAKANFHRIGIESNMVWNKDWTQNLAFTQLFYNAALKNTSWINIRLRRTKEFLPFETQLIDEEYDNLPSDWYTYSSLGFFYRSNARKLFSYNLNGGYGQFYNGTLARLGGSLRYRIQPWGNFELNFERNQVKLPENYGEANLWLIGPRIGVNFSKNLFWTTFFQYNTQADNFNINSRLQWRFKPMSDIFLVYTDNYNVENFGPKTRALVAKCNWWITL